MFSIVPCFMIKLKRNRMNERVCRRGFSFFSIYFSPKNTNNIALFQRLYLHRFDQVKSLCSVIFNATNILLQVTNRNNEQQCCTISFNIHVVRNERKKSELMQTCHKENYVQSNLNENHRSDRTVMIEYLLKTNQRKQKKERNNLKIRAFETNAN